MRADGIVGLEPGKQFLVCVGAGLGAHLLRAGMAAAGFSGRAGFRGAGRAGRGRRRKRVVDGGVPGTIVHDFAAGAAGLVVPDLPLEEAEKLSAIAEAAGLDLVLLVAPTTPSDRMGRIAQASRGFTYLVTGTNGEGEGPLGNQSSGATRPNDSPCVVTRKSPLR